MEPPPGETVRLLRRNVAEGHYSQSLPGRGLLPFKAAQGVVPFKTAAE